MVVYEVNLEFDVAIAAPYREWLAAHVQELLALPGFISAQVHDVRRSACPPPAASACACVTS